MTPNTSENNVQKNTLSLLQKLGYTFIAKEQIGVLRNNSLSTVVLKDVLREQLQKINSFDYRGVEYKFSPKNISRAVDDLDADLSEGLMIANQKISDKLMLGTSYEEELNDGDKKSFSLRYIDFDNPADNVFHCTEEFSVHRRNQHEKEKTRRPDVVLFVNGIPFAVIELKKSSISSMQGITQMVRNQAKDEIPELFKYVQITLAGNPHSPHYGTVNTPVKFYAAWEEQTDLNEWVENRMPSRLDQTVYSLFNQKRVLDIIYSFILFDNKIKKVARYPQYFAIQDIVRRIETYSVDGTRAGGLVWHTQGSGKSLTMVMLTKVLKKQIANSKIIIVIDRVDLDEQINTTFKNSEILADRATSGRDLLEKLQSGVSVITTLIHKFELVKNEKAVFDDANIFVLVDESHRTQGGDLHKAMKKVFPRACYIGFTGTPLLKREKSSIAKFGGIIHKYTIDQAVKDRAVLPLFYEGRLADQLISDQNGLDKKFEMIARDLNEQQKEDLRKKWAIFSKVASSERRLEAIALDISQHFIAGIRGTGFKAMLATSSKYEAVKYQKIFEEFTDIKSAVVISSPDTREGNEEVDNDNKLYVREVWDKIIKEYGSEVWDKIIKEYGSEEQYLAKIKDEFILGDELELLIVVDKLLTGFDAPRASVLYLDKVLKEHNLLQAIARVNRLYDGKDGGFIIDYRGLLGNLDQALTSYSELAGFDEEDLIGAVIDVKQEIAKLKTHYTSLEDLFRGVANKQDNESFEVFLADEKKRLDFYALLSKFGIALKLALSSDKTSELISDSEIDSFKSKFKFYIALRKSVQLRYHEKIDFAQYEKQMQKLLDTFISADDEVYQLTKLVNIFEKEFDQELERLGSDNAKADKILSATAKEIRENMDKNPEFYSKLSKRIEKILEEYREGRLSDEEKLKHAKDIRELLTNHDFESNSEYPEGVSSKTTRALYDNLLSVLDKIPQNEFIQFLLKIDNILFEASKKPDWEINTDVKNQIDQSIDDLLWELGKKYNIKLDDNEIITKAREIGINNYVR